MKQQKFKSALLVMLTLVLVSATAVAITWATTDGKGTNVKKNTFVNTPNIALQLAEDTWNGQDFGSVDTVAPTGTDSITTPITSTAFAHNDDLGENKAKAYNAGDLIDKNPCLKNSTTSTHDTDYIRDPSETSGQVTYDEWVGMSVKYEIKMPATVYGPAAGNTGTGAEATPLSVTALGANNATGANEFIGKWLTFDSYTNFSAALATVRKGTSASNTDGFNLGNGTDSAAGAHNGQWTEYSSGNKTFFVYNNKIAQDKRTNTLFDFVKINEFASGADGYIYATAGGSAVRLYKINIKGATYTYTDNNSVQQTATVDTDNYVYISQLPEFKITLKGYAVQGDNVANLDAAKTELEALRAAENS